MADPLEDAIAADLAKVASMQRFVSVTTNKGSVQAKRGVDYAADVRALRDLRDEQAADAEGHVGVTVFGSYLDRDP